jgi:hypothetical protein
VQAQKQGYRGGTPKTGKLAAEKSPRSSCFAVQKGASVTNTMNGIKHDTKVLATSHARQWLLQTGPRKIGGGTVTAKGHNESLVRVHAQANVGAEQAGGINELL